MVQDPVESHWFHTEGHFQPAFDHKHRKRSKGTFQFAATKLAVKASVSTLTTADFDALQAQGRQVSDPDSGKTIGLTPLTSGRQGSRSPLTFGWDHVRNVCVEINLVEPDRGLPIAPLAIRANIHRAARTAPGCCSADGMNRDQQAPLIPAGVIATLIDSRIHLTAGARGCSYV